MSRYRYVLIMIVGLVFVAGGLLMAARPQAAQRGYEITWLGDTLLGDRGQALLDEKGYSAAFARLPDVGAADLTVLNAEAPLTTLNVVPQGRGVYYPSGSNIPRYDIYTTRGKVTRIIMRSAPAAAHAFAEAGVDVVSLANNHAFDQGVQGLKDSISALRSAGLTSVGAGENASQAMTPHVVDTPYGKVAIFAFAKEGGTVPAATASTPGLLTLSMENLAGARKAAETAGAQWTVAVVHWGRNYMDVNDQQRKWAARFADEEFDLVVGSGPHVAQPIEIMKRTPIVFSLGNFVFQQLGRFTAEQEGFGLILTAVLGPGGFRELRVTCLDVDNKRVAYQPRLAAAADAARILPKISPVMTIDGAVGILRW